MRSLPSPLYIVCDAGACAAAGWNLVDFGDACLQGGATLLQVRAKSAPSGWLLDATARIVEKARPAGALVIVNDRADIARIANAGGIHVGQDDLTPAAVRDVLGASGTLGLSTHTAAQVEGAARQPVDYVAIGPVFATATKDTGYAAIGVQGVRQASAIARARGMPVAAIGGITLERAPEILAAGAASVAIIGDVFATGRPEQRVRQYLSVLQAG